MDTHQEINEIKHTPAGWGTEWVYDKISERSNNPLSLAARNLATSLAAAQPLVYKGVKWPGGTETLCLQHCVISPWKPPSLLYLESPTPIRVELCPPKDVEVLTSISVNMIFFGYRAFVDQIRMKSLGWTPIQFYLMCPYQNERFGHRDRHVHRENTTWGWRYIRGVASTSKESQRLPEIHEKLREKQGTSSPTFSSQPSEGTNRANLINTSLSIPSRPVCGT